MHKTTTALLAAGVFLAVLLTVTGATWLGNGRHLGPPAPQPRVEQADTYSSAHSHAPVAMPTAHPLQRHAHTARLMEV